MLCALHLNSISSTVQGSFENLEKVRNSGVKVLIHFCVLLNPRLVLGYQWFSRCAYFSRECSALFSAKSLSLISGKSIMLALRVLMQFC